MSDSEIQESILNSVKKSLNIQPEVTAFDPDLIMHINASLSKLHQMGVGPKEPFVIEDSSATWTEYGVVPRNSMIPSYVYLDVRLVFDPPTASVLSSMKERLDELGWRLNVCDDELLYAGRTDTEEDDDE